MVLNEADVVLCLGREVIPLPDCRRVRLPSREGLILNLHFVQNVHVGYDRKKSITYLSLIQYYLSPNKADGLRVFFSHMSSSIKLPGKWGILFPLSL